MNDDDIVTRVEFDAHAANYKKGFPQASENDFPDFDEIDLNHDMMLNFQEWQHYISLGRNILNSSESDGAIQNTFATTLSISNFASESF